MLDEIRIRNYRSLKDTAVPLRAFNVFIGPNNSGKSNIFDCLRFLSGLVRQRQGEPVHERGGYSSIVWNGDLSRSIGIEISGHEPSRPLESMYGLEPPQNRYRFQYVLQLAGGPAHFQIVRERFVVWAALPEAGSANSVEMQLLDAGPKGRVLFEFPSTGQPSMATSYDLSGKPTASWGGGGLQSYMWAARDSSRNPVLGDFAQSLEGWGFYNPVPSMMRGPVPARRELKLQERAENLSSVLHSFHSEFPKNFREIEDWLHEAVPEISTLLTGLTEASQTYVFIEEQGLGARIPSWAMSEGTLRLLAHLAVVCSPSPPALVCFEEPENYLHPRALELLANALKKASDRTQVLLSTHSPYLLNFLEPDDLQIVEKKDGGTVVSRVQDPEGVKEALKTLGLGEMWYAGHLGGTN